MASSSSLFPPQPFVSTSGGATSSTTAGGQDVVHGQQERVAAAGVLAASSSSSAMQPGVLAPPLSVVDLLPDQVWVEYIILFLNIKEIGQLAKTCKILNNLILNEPFVWQMVASVQVKSSFNKGFEIFVGAIDSPTAQLQHDHQNGAESIISNWQKVVLMSNAKLLTSTKGVELLRLMASTAATSGATARSGIRDESDVNSTNLFAAGQLEPNQMKAINGGQQAAHAQEPPRPTLDSRIEELLRNGPPKSDSNQGTELLRGKIKEHHSSSTEGVGFTAGGEGTSSSPAYDPAYIAEIVADLEEADASLNDKNQRDIGSRPSGSGSSSAASSMLTARSDASSSSSSGLGFAFAPGEGRVSSQVQLQQQPASKRPKHLADDVDATKEDLSSAPAINHVGPQVGGGSASSSSTRKINGAVFTQDQDANLAEQASSFVQKADRAQNASADIHNNNPGSSYIGATGGGSSSSSSNFGARDNSNIMEQGGITDQHGGRGDHETNRKTTSSARFAERAVQPPPRIRMREELLQPTGIDDFETGAAKDFFAGHAPHLHWLGGTRLLAFAGNYYADRIGGATPKELPFVYEIDVKQTPVKVVETVNYGLKDPATDQFLHGTPHPQIMGAASSVWRGKVVFFGGGSPIDQSKINNCVSVFDIREKRWERLWGITTTEVNNQPAFTGINRNARSGATSAEQAALRRANGSGSVSFQPNLSPCQPQGIPGEDFPKPRQGQRGTVFRDKFFIFGGRELTIGNNRIAQADGTLTRDNGCRNDLWSFNLLTKQWKKEQQAGDIPAPRVWYASTEATNGRWLITGGSLWDFKKTNSEETVRQYQDLYCLHLASNYRNRGGGQLSQSSSAGAATSTGSSGFNSNFGEVVDHGEDDHYDYYNYTSSSTFEARPAPGKMTMSDEVSTEGAGPVYIWEKISLTPTTDRLFPAGDERSSSTTSRTSAGAQIENGRGSGATAGSTGASAQQQPTTTSRFRNFFNSAFGRLVPDLTYPDWVTAGQLVATGRELLYFGGTKPQNIGEEGITFQKLMDESEETGWPCWYSDLARNAFVFDTVTKQWTSSEKMETIFHRSCDTKSLRRSHFAACFVPTTGQIFVFGGSRYFVGEYFHDVITLDLPHSEFSGKKDVNEKSEIFPGKLYLKWKGQIGRLRGILFSGDITNDRMRDIFQEIRDNEEADEEQAEQEQGNDQNVVSEDEDHEMQTPSDDDAQSADEEENAELRAGVGGDDDVDMGDT
ncbi:unnamed protein product [Amoebophrya sp. A120]|nr:unnamed protein product [Amoebophrya sp. A120]|eukprot:GSA120T00019912001.1